MLKSLPQLCVVCLTLFPTIAYAQTQSDVDRANQQSQQFIQREQQRQREEQLRLEQQKPAKIAVDVPSAEDAAPTDDTCFDVQQIILEGSEKLSRSDRRELVEPYLNRCIGLAEINELVRAVTNRYIQKGYVTTRAYIPQQDLSSGTLEILIVEGILKEIRYEGEKKSVNTHLVLPNREGKVLNLNDIEHGLEQLNRLKSNNITLDLQPGEEPGETILVLKNDQSRRINGYAFMYDNSGSDGTGKYQGGSSVNLENLAGLNEILNISFRTDLHKDSKNRKSETLSANFSIPYGYWTFGMSASMYDYISVVEGSTQSFKTRGDADTYRLYVDRVIYRQRGRLVSVSTSLTHKNNKNFLQDALLTSSSRKLSIVDIDVKLRTPVAGGSLSASTGMAIGTRLIGADRDSENLSRTAPRNQFEKYKLALSYYRPFRLWGLNWAASSSAEMQGANDYLPGTEQLSIGSRYTVRGFDQKSIQGDGGGYLRNEISLQLPETKWAWVDRMVGSMSPYIGYDIGRIWHRTDQRGGTLSGVAIGMRNYRGIVNFDVTYARILHAKDAFEEDNKGVLYFSFNLPF